MSKDNVIRYYDGTAKSGEIRFAAKLRDTVVCAEYPCDEANPVNLYGVAQLLTKQLIKAHILESLTSEPSEALYQATVHVAESVSIPPTVRWNHMRGVHDTITDFADAVKRRHV